MNYQLYFYILSAVIAAGILISIGIFIGARKKSDGNILKTIFNIFKFIIETERLTLPGKVNFCGGILLLFAIVITSIPTAFALAYNFIFKKQEIKVSEPKEMIIYLIVCGLVVTFTESLILYKTKIAQLQRKKP